MGKAKHVGLVSGSEAHVLPCSSGSLRLGVPRAEDDLGGDSLAEQVFAWLSSQVLAREVAAGLLRPSLRGARCPPWPQRGSEHRPRLVGLHISPEQSRLGSHAWNQEQVDGNLQVAGK